MDTNTPSPVRATLCVITDESNSYGVPHVIVAFYCDNGKVRRLITKDTPTQVLNVVRDLGFTTVEQVNGIQWICNR